MLSQAQPFWILGDSNHRRLQGILGVIPIPRQCFSIAQQPRRHSVVQPTERRKIATPQLQRTVSYRSGNCRIVERIHVNWALNCLY